jgi:hypothetical protein
MPSAIHRVRQRVRSSEVLRGFKNGTKLPFKQSKQGDKPRAMRSRTTLP